MLPQIPAVLVLCCIVGAQGGALESAPLEPISAVPEPIQDKTEVINNCLVNF